jgi:hypothetical protein
VLFLLTRLNLATVTCRYVTDSNCFVHLNIFLPLGKTNDQLTMEQPSLLFKHIHVTSSPYRLSWYICWTPFIIYEWMTSCQGIQTFRQINMWLWFLSYMRPSSHQLYTTYATRQTSESCILNWQLWRKKMQQQQHSKQLIISVVRTSCRVFHAPDVLIKPTLACSISKSRGDWLLRK